MKRLFVLIMLGALTVSAHAAYTIDGLISQDWGVDLSAAGSKGYLDAHRPTAPNVDVFTEDNTDASAPFTQVFPGYSNNNYFDAEALYFDNDSSYAYLALVSGLPQAGSLAGTPVNGNDAYMLKPGDIGFDLNSDGFYEYGLNIRDKSLYSVISWNDVIYPEFASTNPWTINQGTKLGDVDFAYSGDQNSHYVMEARIPLGLLGLADAYHPLNIHWTMECGNDVLDLGADVDPVPEPSTMALMFMGIAGSALTFIRRRYNELRRAFDVIIASASLLVLAPVLAFCAALIKLDSAGPVFYKQVRIGQNRRSRRNRVQVEADRRASDTLGKPFTIYKLRTMQANAESATGPIWAGKNDGRVTRVGKFLRLTRLDEIPQFINVLKGDMSIVGPRPERPAFTHGLNRQIRYYYRRFNVKPGITGLAQVRYPYAATVKDTRNKLKYDLLYVKKRCMFMDLQIFVNTFWTVLLAKGAR